MAVVASSNPGADNINAQKTAKVEGFVGSGETLPALSAGYFQADGSIALSLGAAANAAGAVHGVCLRTAETGEPVTLYGAGTVFQWTDAGSLTPGAQYFLGAAGGVDDAATLGDSTGVFVAISNTDLMLIKLQGIGG